MKSNKTYNRRKTRESQVLSPYSLMLRKNTAIKILKLHLLKLIVQMESQRLLRENEGKSVSDLLIEIIEKMNSKQTFEENYCEKIILLLKQLAGFQSFIRYNSINDACLRMAVSNIKISRYKAGSYIFLQGSTTKQFYGILQGCIAIRVRKPTYEKALNMIIKNKPKKEIKAFNFRLNPAGGRLSFIEKKKTFDENVTENNQVKNPEEKNQNSLETNEVVNTIEKLSDRKINLHRQVSAFDELPLIESVNEESQNDDDKKLEEEQQLRKKTTSLVRRMLLSKEERNYLDTEHEDERLRMYEGQCFGEWSLIYKIPRTGSALALTDSVLFCIEKEDFDKSLSKALLKAETERKKFILQIIPSFTKIPNQKFEEFYRKIIALFVNKNEIIFSETTETSVFYVVYLGNCKIQKNLMKSEKNSYNILDMKLTTIMHLERGDICGLEALFGSQYYDYTLVASSDCVLFKIDLNLIMFEFRTIIMQDLNSLYKLKKQYMNIFLEKNLSFREKMKIKFRDLKKSLNYDPITIKIKENQQKFENHIFEINEKNKMKCNSASKIQISNIKISGTKKSKIKKKENDNSSGYLPKLISENNSNMNTYENLNKYKIHDDSKLNSHTRFSSMNSNFSFSTNIEHSSHNLHKHKINSSNKKSFFRKHIFDEGQSKSANHTHGTIEKDECENKEKKSELVKNRKKIFSSLNIWKNLNINKNYSFNTGHFNIPLYVLKDNKK